MAVSFKEAWPLRPTIVYLLSSFEESILSVALSRCKDGCCARLSLSYLLAYAVLGAVLVCSGVVRIFAGAGVCYVSAGLAWPGEDRASLLCTASSLSIGFFSVVLSGKLLSALSALLLSFS